MGMNLDAKSSRGTRSPGGWQVALVASLVAAVLSLTGLRAGEAWGAPGGLPGTGDIRFNPAADSEGNHCYSPNGADVNDLLEVSEFLFVPGDCDVMETGEFYVPIFGPSTWVLGPTWLEVPADYTPSAPTPLEDFVSKVRSVTFTVDPGMPLERSYRFAAHDIMDVRSLRDFLGESVPDVPVVLFLAKLPPLPPGDHRIVFYMEMSERFCDGLGTGSANCLPAGTTRLGSCPFTVVPRQPPASLS